MKYAICILAHHYPWLMMSSLISLAIQKERDYDLHIIYIKGNGDLRNRNSYREFYEIADRTKHYNPQLTPDNEQILELLKNIDYDITYHEFENDHGLDSGAWYRFIKKGIWRGYDYVFFFMEGFIFTRDNVLTSVKKFIRDDKPHFLDMGFEKRIASRWLIDNYFIRHENVSEMDYYHQEIINKVFKKFCLDIKFFDLYNKWQNDSFLKPNALGSTFYHVPSSIYTIGDRLRLFIRNLIVRKKLLPPVGHFILENPTKEFHLIKDLSSNYKFVDKVIFHQEYSPYFFCCGCQHIFSNQFLNSMYKKFEEKDLWSVIEYPFSATPLEPIWGMLPAWLNYDKWFFDGVHRPRKNFISYKREDDPFGMCHYLNIYYKGQLKVKPFGENIRIEWLNHKFKYIHEMLGDQFFC